MAAFEHAPVDVGRDKKIAENDIEEFWLIGDDVYRASKPCMLDTYGLPSSKRWECSFLQWKRFRDIFDAKDTPA